MRNISTTAFVAASLTAAQSFAYQERQPWTCRQLETSTDPFYRMFPAYLGNSLPDDVNVTIPSR